jgi:hypothetical protein
MAFSKKLKNITVTHSPGQVGVSLFYHSETPENPEPPAEHLLLSISVATQFRDKLSKALTLASQALPPGDSILMSDHGSLNILNPKEH